MLLVKYSKPKAMLSRARSFVKKGIKVFWNWCSSWCWRIYLAGAKLRRYKKAPKPGRIKRSTKSNCIATYINELFNNYGRTWW